jgi:DNA-binding Lrp family transcriptional regulator
MLNPIISHFLSESDMALDNLDKQIIACLQGDIPLTSRPWAQTAKELGISEAELVVRIQAMADSGVMRRFGATLRHQRSGFESNVMVAWNVSEDEAERVGEKLAGYRFVSHCYWRERCGDFPYNLYSMIHGRSDDECRILVDQMSRETGIKDYAMLYSRKELKKTSMRYFETQQDATAQ